MANIIFNVVIVLCPSSVELWLRGRKSRKASWSLLIYYISDISQGQRWSQEMFACRFGLMQRYFLALHEMRGPCKCLFCLTLNNITDFGAFESAVIFLADGSASHSLIAF